MLEGTCIWQLLHKSHLRLWPCVCSCRLRKLNVIKLWLPIGSEFVNNYEHLWHTHPPEIRLHQMVFHVEGGGDILRPQYFKQVG